MEVKFQPRATGSVVKGWQQQSKNEEKPDVQAIYIFCFNTFSNTVIFFILSIFFTSGGDQGKYCG